MTLSLSRLWPGLVAAVFALGSGASSARAAGEQGRLLSRVFLPEDYRGEVQISDVVQTSDGLIYGANLGAVKEYDGRTWRTIPVPTSWIMDLAAGPDGRVYLAGVDELGFLEKNADGLRVFRSILDLVPAGLQPLGQQWAVFVHEGAAYWSTNTAVLRWRDGVLHTWTFSAEGRRVIHAGGKHLYLASVTEGLLRLVGETWEVISTHPEAKNLPSGVLDDWVVPSVTLMDRDGHVWRLEGMEGATEFPTELAAAVAAVDGARLSDTIRLRDERLAIATKNAGIIVLNQQGGIDVRFGTEGGLNVLNLYGGSEDREGGLWIGTAYGCVRVELDPSLTVFDQKNGAPPGNMYRLVRYEGRLFACGQDGLYRFAPGAAGNQGRFERVPTEHGFIPYDLLAHPTGLLIGSDRGLFRYAEGIITPQFRPPHSINSIARSASDPARIFLGGVEFVHSLHWDGTTWNDEGPIAAAQEDVRSMVEDTHGVLWLGTPSHGVARVRRQPGHEDWQSAVVDVFDDTRGLPAGHDWLSVYPSPLGPLFTHAKGVSVHDPARDALIPAVAFTTAGIGGRYTYPLTAGNGGALWLQLGYPAAGETPELGGLLPAAGGGWEWQALSAGVYAALGYLGAGDFFWEPAGDEGVLWILGQQNIVRWELNGALRDRAAAAPAVVLRGIARGAARFSLDGNTPPRLDHGRDPLRVQFASPVYALKGTVEYQYRLSGYDERWSPWAENAAAVFTNLPGGSFTFEVRARRGGGAAGPVTAWNFSVQPPWWRRAPLLGLYAVAVVALGWLLLRWRLAALVRDRARLEREVRQRTEELARERDRAEAANRAKTMFLASMSHELRTPLHAILGYSQLLGGDLALPETARARIHVVATSGQHLLRLINEVLDLSRIEAGKLELRAAPFDLPALLAEIGDAQETRAQAKNLVFRRPELAGLPVRVAGDAQKLRQILDNLLSNAVKFTATGEVRLGVMPVAAGRLHFEVSDTGPGIAPDDVRRLFEPFTQAGAGAETAERGSGLGLAIAQRLVALMGGELRVASTVGEGSRFWFEIALAPVTPTRTGEKAAAARRIIGYEGPRRRVLAVDDVEANRLLFRDLLAPLGFEVALAGSADEALALLEPVRPDLVLLDLRLPGMDGFALARCLRGDPRLEGVKILAASASVFGHDPGEALAAGCDGFIAKPFLPAEFFDRVAQLLALTWTEAEAAASATTEALAPSLLEALQAAARLGDVVALRDAFMALQARHPRAAALTEIEQAIAAFNTDRVGQLAAQHLRRGRSA